MKISQMIINKIFVKIPNSIKNGSVVSESCEHTIYLLYIYIYRNADLYK